ncbi:MAG: SDR family NAD(P)-dependent oxidoreductase, partial [Acidiferrobacterales bacterium]
MSTSFDLSGEVALVTGASSGLGRHFAQTLASAGARVVVAARRRQRLQALAAQIESEGGHALALSMDVTEAESVAEAFATAQDKLGPVTVVVNNAGV